MLAATMTSKGQITVPKEVRDELRLRPGAKIRFARAGNGAWSLFPRTGDVMDLAGMLYDPNRRTLTLEEMEEAIADGWAESGLRGSPGHEYTEPM